MIKKKEAFHSDCIEKGECGENIDSGPMNWVDEEGNKQSLGTDWMDSTDNWYEGVKHYDWDKPGNNDEDQAARFFT